MSRDGLAAEANAFHRIEVGNVGHQALDTASTTDRLGNSDITEFDVAVFLDQSGGTGTVLIDLLAQSLLECGHASLSFTMNLKSCGSIPAKNRLLEVLGLRHL